MMMWAMLPPKPKAETPAGVASRRDTPARGDACMGNSAGKPLTLTSSLYVCPMRTASSLPFLRPVTSGWRWRKCTSGGTNICWASTTSLEKLAMPLAPSRCAMLVWMEPKTSGLDRCRPGWNTAW